MSAEQVVPQFSPTLFDPMDCSTQGFPVLYQLPLKWKPLDPGFHWRGLDALPHVRVSAV